MKFTREFRCKESVDVVIFVRGVVVSLVPHVRDLEPHLPRLEVEQARLVHNLGKIDQIELIPDPRKCTTWIPVINCMI